MAIDTRRVVLAALEAGVEEAKRTSARKRRLRVSRVLLVGAGAVTAGRLAGSSRGRELLGSLQERLAELDVPVPGGSVDDQALAEQNGAAEAEPVAAAPAAGAKRAARGGRAPARGGQTPARGTARPRGRTRS